MEANETPRIEVAGVTVTKRYEPERFAVPAIGFEIYSDRGTAAEIRLEERLPEGFSADGIGFHPAYDEECWTAHPEGRLVFESRLDPGTTLVTVYGIRITDDEKADAFMADPELTVRAVDPAEPDVGLEIVADGAGDAMPVAVTRVEDGGPRSVPANPARSVAAALAAELRVGTVSEKDRAALRQALGAADDRERVQIDHLQVRVSELEAYTAAFEGFLGENGTAAALVEELRGGLEELRADVRKLESEIGVLAGEQRSALDSTAEEIDALAADVDEHGEIAADVDAVSDDLDALYDQVDELQVWREQMGAAFGGK